MEECELTIENSPIGAAPREGVRVPKRVISTNKDCKLLAILRFKMESKEF